MTDLVNRLRLEAEADVAAVDKAIAANQALGRSGEQASAGLNAAATASQRVDQTASAAAGAAAREAAALTALGSAGQQAGAGVAEAANQNTRGAQVALTAEAATARQAASIGALGTVARGAAGFVGGMVAGFMTAGAAAVATAALVAVFGNALKQLSDDFNATALGATAAAKVLADMQDNAREAAGLVAHLADETSNSADQAHKAASGYDAQSLSLQTLNQRLREMNSLQLVAAYQDNEKRIKDLRRSMTGGGVFGFLNTDPVEAEANARKRLLQSLGFGALGDKTGQNRTPDQAIAQASAQVRTLPTAQREALMAYNAAQLTKNAQDLALRDALQARPVFEKQMLGQDDGVTLLDEITVTPPRQRKTPKTPKTPLTDEERDAKRRLENAEQMTVAYNLEARAQRERAEAAIKGAAALEELEVKQAGLRVLERQGVESIDELTGKVRDQTQAAIDAAEAAERQAQATEKTARVAGASQEMDRAIALEERRGVAIASGTAALVQFNQAERIRADIERVGLTLTADQVEALKAKGVQLAQIQAANDNADFYRQQAEELRLMQLTNQERDLEERKLRIRNQLLAEGRAIVEGEVAARAKTEQDEFRIAETIGNLRKDLRAAFVESGRLGFDEIGDYATRRLREAVYDALLAKPIDVIINAVIGNVEGLANQLGSLLGGSALSSVLGPAALAFSAGKQLGLGTGNAGADVGLGLAGGVGGMVLANSTLGAGLAAATANGLVGIGAGAGIAGGVGNAMMSAAVMGPIGVLAGLALGTIGAKLLDNGYHPYARADVGVVNGQFAVTGADQQDKGPIDAISQAGAAIAQSLNAAADLFKLDLTKFNGPTSIGYVEGNHLGQLSKGYFGGEGGGFSTGAQFEGFESADAVAAEIVRATILRAIDAGASDLSEAEKRVVREATSLQDAADKIALGRSISETISDAMLQLTNPAAFERKKALDAIEESYAALKQQAEQLIAAGLASADLIDQLNELRDLQIQDALAAAMNDAADELRAAWANEKAAREQTIAELTVLADNLAAYAKTLTTGPAAALSPENQYLALKSEFEEISAKASQGDKEAAEQLLTIGPQFLEASKAYNGANAQYFLDLKAVRTAVTEAEKLTRDQIDIQKQMLEAQKKAVEVLISIDKGVTTLAEAIDAYMKAQAANQAAGGAALPEGFTAEKYLAANPDLAADWNAGGVMKNLGATLNEAAVQHWLKTGQSEGRKFAEGAIFPGGGIVTQPTSFDIGTMAEVNPEAIMPLFRGPRGLGVQVASSSSRRTEQLLEQNIELLEALVRQNGAAANGQIAALGEVASELQAVGRQLAAAA